jgi:TPR repeat protein
MENVLMSRKLNPSKQPRQSKAIELFIRADKQQELGKLRSAFRLFLAAAKLGEPSCQARLGSIYADGIGVKPNRKAALYWYRRASQQGEGSAAFNLGIVFRDEENFKDALLWFQRAVALGVVDANLEIAKIYLRNGKYSRKAIEHLKVIRKAKAPEVFVDTQGEANRLLKQFGS